MTGPPEHIPDGAKAVVRGDLDLIGNVTYDLWIVDGQHWTGRMTKTDALARLIAEGYRKNRARQLLARARQHAVREATRA